MTRLFILADSGLPDAPQLETSLKRVAGTRYAVSLAVSLEALLEQLETARHAVVFFAAPPEKIVTLIHQYRQVLPGTAFVAVTDEQDVHQIPMLETDCHFIQRPFDDFAVLSHLSAALRQAELLSTIAGSAQQDEVTNLFNRRYFIQRLGEEISLARRHLSPLCCVILGVNYYQMYLDSYGYDFINALLRYLADQTSSMIRHEDIIARTGDDEIAILLPRSTEKGAKVFTNRLILQLNATQFKYGNHTEPVSICAGIAGYPLPDQSEADADTVIRYARHALHQARCSHGEHVRVQLFSEIKPVL